MIKIFHAFCVIGLLSVSTYAESANKQRLIVLTDIGNEPDDTQSMVRLMLYSNVIDIKGLIASTSVHQLKHVHPEMIKNVINGYEKVQPNLLKHEVGFPTAQKLLKLVKNGLPLCGMDGVGEGKDSEGSDWIIKMLEQDDKRPLWVAVWGGANTLAQSLWKIRSTRSEAEATSLIGKLRVYAISDQDDSGPWIRKNFPDLFYISTPGDPRTFTWIGLQINTPGANNEVVSNSWLYQNIQQDHGPLGAIYPDIAWGIEGDTPSFLSLIPNGLNEPEHPNWGGWGGRYEFYKPVCDSIQIWVVNKEETRPYWTKAKDTFAPRIWAEWGRALIKDTATYSSNQVTIWRWREEIQNDFAARMDWCTGEYKSCNHPPIAKVNIPERFSVKSGEKFSLDGSASYDPDGDNLSYQWFQYSEAGTLNQMIDIPIENISIVNGLKAPAVDSLRTVHFILKVTDKGSPRLTHYKRIVVSILPN